jgi:hypothetical protein
MSHVARASGSEWIVGKQEVFTKSGQHPFNLQSRLFVSWIELLNRQMQHAPMPVRGLRSSSYGDTPKKVGELIILAIKAGAIGCNLETASQKMAHYGKQRTK